MSGSRLRSARLYVFQLIALAIVHLPYVIAFELVLRANAFRSKFELSRHNEFADRGFETVANLFPKFNLYANFISDSVFIKKIIMSTAPAKTVVYARKFTFSIEREFSANSLFSFFFFSSSRTWKMHTTIAFSVRWSMQNMDSTHRIFNSNKIHR